MTAPKLSQRSGAGARRHVGAATRRPTAAAPFAQPRRAFGPTTATTPAGARRLASHNERLDVELGGPAVDVQSLAAGGGEDGGEDGGAGGEPLYDCLGLAQAMVDVATVVEDELLQGELGLEKGSRRCARGGPVVVWWVWLGGWRHKPWRALHGLCTRCHLSRPVAPLLLPPPTATPPPLNHRRLISLEERSRVMERLAGRDTAVAAGGSLSNTLLALARLSAAGGAGLRVGMAGLVGADALGSFYAAQLEAAGVRVAAAPTPGAATGTVLVLTSGTDASRTMLSYLGTPAEIAVDAALQAAIARSRLLVVEGYLWELPSAAHTVAKVRAAAASEGPRWWLGRGRRRVSCKGCLPACLLRALPLPRNAHPP